jgi:hypothetical protein
VEGSVLALAMSDRAVFVDEVMIEKDKQGVMTGEEILGVETAAERRRE